MPNKRVDDAGIKLDLHMFVFPPHPTPPHLASVTIVGHEGKRHAVVKRLVGGLVVPSNLSLRLLASSLLKLGGGGMRVPVFAPRAYPSVPFS